MARIASSLLAAVAAACALALVLLAPAAGAHVRARHRSASGCVRSASYHAGHRGRHRRRCVRHRSRHHAHPRHPAHRHVVHRDGGRSSDTGCPGAGTMPSEANLDVMRSAVICLENREREAHGEAPLRPDQTLQSAAQAHSENMVSHAYFDHVGPDGTPLQRMRAAGYLANPAASYEVGENLAWGTLWLSTPREIVAGWMASPGHRANVLDAHFRDTAVGIAVDLPRSLSGGQRGGMYTQDFGVVSHG